MQASCGFLFTSGTWHREVNQVRLPNGVLQGLLRSSPDRGDHIGAEPSQLARESGRNYRAQYWRNGVAELKLIVSAGPAEFEVVRERHQTSKLRDS